MPRPSARHFSAPAVAPASAAERPQQSAFGEDAYPTITLKVAALMQSLAKNQPFVDCNNRIAWISTFSRLVSGMAEHPRGCRPSGEYQIR
jgi:hypothetical protein